MMECLIKKINQERENEKENTFDNMLPFVVVYANIDMAE